MDILPNYSIKDIIDLVKKGSEIEAQEKIMKLRQAALKIHEENLDLKKRVRELEKALSQKDSVIYETPFYWVENDGKKEGPYCQVCYDDKSKLIRLNDYWDDGNWGCHLCRSIYSPDKPDQRQSYLPGGK